MNFFSYIFYIGNNFRFFQGLKHLFFELFFGIQIADLISDTSSIEKIKSERVYAANRMSNVPRVVGTGMIDEASAFIPTSMITALFKASIENTIKEKYCKTYGFLGEENGKLTVNKNKLNLLSSYRMFINSLWVMIEFIISFAGYVFTGQSETSVFLFFILELIRKFKI